MSIHLIAHPRAGRYAFTFELDGVIFLHAGFRFQARAIAAATDICAKLGAVPKFVR